MIRDTIVQILINIISHPVTPWVLSTFLIPATGIGIKLYKEHECDHKMLKNANKVLLKAQILDIWNRYKDNGHLGEYEIEMINELYFEYAAMGGNGYIKNIVDKVNDIDRRHVEE